MYVYASVCINPRGARHGAAGGSGIFGRTGYVGDRALAARAVRRPGRVLCRRRGAGGGGAHRTGRESEALRRDGLRNRRPPRGVRAGLRVPHAPCRSEEHTSELQSQSNLVCRLLLEKKKKSYTTLT